jgi:large subunit ribosomal protein L24
MNKIRKGDQVIVLTGRDKGKRGTVSLRVDDEKVIVDGVNVVDKTMPIHQSNVAIFNAATGKADRVGVKTLADGKRVRVFKSSGAEIKA